MDFSKVLSRVEPQVLAACVVNLDNIVTNYHRIEDEVEKKAEGNGTR